MKENMEYYEGRELKERQGEGQENMKGKEKQGEEKEGGEGRAENCRRVNYEAK